jgi:hypothetical protein
MNSTKSASPIEQICFIHVGPQDKPMPEFCVVIHSSRTNHENPIRPEIIVSPLTLDSIFHRCIDPESKATRLTTGVYSVEVDSERLFQLIGPSTMLKISESVRKDRLLDDKPIPDVIIHLQRRLGVSIDVPCQRKVE